MCWIDLGKNDLANERFWLAALHLSSMFCIVLIPLLIWSWMKTRSYQIDSVGGDRIAAVAAGNQATPLLK